MALTKVTNSMILGASINVLDFGAVGDGVNDDASAIQSAIDALPVVGGEIVFPARNYFIGTGLTTGVKKSVKLRGAASMNQPVENSAALITATSAITMLTAGDASETTASGIEIENISFKGGASVVAGVKILRQNFVRLSRVSVGGITTGTGIVLDGTGDSNTLNQLDGVFVRNCLTGIQANTTAALRVFGGSYVTCSSLAGSVGFSGINIETTYFDGFSVDQAEKHMVLDANSVRSTGVGIRLEGSVAAGVGIEVSGDENFFFGTTVNLVGAGAIGFDIKSGAENTRLIHSEFVGISTSNRVVDSGSQTVRVDRFANYDMSGVPFGYGTTVTTGASGSDFILANNTKIRGVNAAGTVAQSILSLDATDRTTLESPRARTGDGQTLMLFNTANESGAIANTLVFKASGATGYTIRWQLPDYQVSASASAGGATLPANPVGFMDIEINGTLRKIPYYA